MVIIHIIIMHRGRGPRGVSSFLPLGGAFRARPGARVVYAITPGYLPCMAKKRLEQNLAENTRRTYTTRSKLLAMDATDPLVFIASVERAMQGIPLGSALPLRAAAARHLVDRFQYTEAAAAEALPSTSGMKAASTRFALEPVQIDAYLGAVAARPDDQVRVALYLLLETGLRPSELCQLRAGDVHETGYGCLLTISGKSASTRQVPVFNARGKWVLGRSRSRPPEHFVFESRGPEGSAKPMCQGALNGAVSGYHNRGKWYPGIAEAINEPRLTPYILRHTYGTELRRKGVQLDVIAQLMGHEDMETTRIYAHLANDDIVEAARLVSR